MVRETRYLIVRNLPENCTEETVIDHFQRYGKIQSVKLQAAKDSDAGSTATVAFNDIKSAAKAHHAKNNIGEVTLRTDYWEGSTGTAVLASAPVAGASAVRSATYASSAVSTSARVASAFSSWSKGTSEEDVSSIQDKGDVALTPAVPGGNASAVTASAVLDKLSSTAYDPQRGRARERIKQKKFGQKFEKSGSFGRHGTSTSSRSLEAARSHSEAVAAAAVATSSSTVAPIPTGTSTPVPSSASGTSGLNPIIVCDSKDLTSKDLKDSSRESVTRSRPHSVASPSSRNSCVKRSNSQSRSASQSRSRSRGSASSSSQSHSSATSRSTSPHRSHTSSSTRPQSMVGTSRLVNSEVRDTKQQRDDGDNERRSLGICVMGLPLRSSDSSLRDGLFHEYKKHGKVTAVQICGDGESRCAIISFRKPEDASKALEASQSKIFFGEKINVMSHEGIEVDDNDIDSMDEYHLKSTRTLFVGNLEKDTTTQDLHDKFKAFGKIIDVDIKRQGAATAFAFIQYNDIVSVVNALRAMDGEHIGVNKIKLGFGKSMPTCTVWLDNLPSDASNRSLKSALSRHGEVDYCYVDRTQKKALVYFTTYEDAQRCVNDVKNRPKILKKKLHVDFASRECQIDFLDRMEKSGLIRASERPDETREHKFHQQRSFDSFQEDGSPTTYGFNRTSSSFSTRNGRSSSGSTSYRRSSRQYRDSNFQHENHVSTRRSRRTEEFSQGTQFYNSKGSGDDYDAVLREYGHSQRERREQDVSPRHSADRRVDSQSRQSSRDHSLDRYEKDRTIEIYNSRDTSPDSDNNSYHSDVRYKSSRDDKYSSHDRYDDSKAEDKEFDRHTRQNHNQSPYAHNRSSSHSHDSDYEHRGGSRSQSPPTPIQQDSLIHRIYYPEDYKRKAELDDDFNHYPVSQKQKDSDDISSIKSKTVSIHSTRLGAEVIKTADKNRKRTHEESGLSDSNNLDAKLLRKSEKSNSSYNEKSKKHHYETSRQILKSQEHNCSPGSSGSHGDSENGSVSEGDLRHLHQEKHHILRKLQELNEEGVGTSEPDSPRSIARVKSVAVKDALKISGRSREERKSDDLFLRNDTHRRQSGKVRSSDSRRESRNYITEELSASREDKNLVVEKEESFGGNSDSDFGSDYKRIKRRKTDPTAASSKNKGSSQRPSSVEVSDDELDKKSDQSFRIHSSSVVKRLSCDSRNSSKFYRDSNKEVEVSSCDNGDLFKDGLSDKDISVIKQPLTVPKSESYFPSKSWNVDYSGHGQSPIICFSPAYSEEHTQDSITSGSLTEKSYKHLSPHPWQHSPPASVTIKDNLDGDYAYYKDNIPDSTSPDDDCLSDDSIGLDLQPAPGEPSVEERIRAIDEILNMSVNKPADSPLLIAALANRDVTNNNDNMTLYSKFRIRKREGILDGGNGSLLMEKKPEPSVIMQQVLSKKSILDQDQRRLEHMNEKYDVGGRKDFSAVLNSEISFSKLSDLKMEAYPKSLLSPSAFPSAWSHPVAMTTTTITTTSSSLSSLSASSLPMTTISSSVLHPTVTPLSSCVGFVSTDIVTTVVSVPIVTSSIYTSAKTTFVDTCKRSGVRPPEYSEDTLDKFPICAHSLTFKENTITQSSLSSSSLLSSSSHPSSSIPVLTFSNNSISSSSSSSSLSSTVNGCTIVTETTTTTTTASQQSCKLTVSSPLPSLLSPQSVSSTSNLISSSVHSKISLQQNVLPSSSSYTSSVSSSVGQSPGGAPAAAPFTQGPDKSQLTPTVGQEAPRLCSPSFTPENSRTSVSAHLPESRSPRVPITPDDSQKTSSKTDLKVSVSMETGSRISSEELKSNNLLIKSEAVSPDIESPVSVKSETSSIASVPLSSLDIKSKEEKMVLAPLTVMISSCSKYGLGCSLKSPDQGKPGLLSVDFHTEGSHSAEKGDKGQEGVSECLRKGGEINEAAESLVSIKMELSPHVNNQVVLSVVNRDSSNKDLSDLPDTSSGGKGKLGPPSSSLNSDSSLKLSSSSSTAPPSSSTTPSRPSLDKSEKRVSGKTSGNYKTSGSPAKSEALFAPDVKMEQPIKSSESKPDARHQNKDLTKGVSNKSSSSDKKSTKPPSKDGVDSKDVAGNKEPEKSEKKSEAGGKNSLGQQESNRSKEASKTKDKRDQSKDGEKAKQREDSKKKEEKKVAEKKKEKKNQAVKDEKKVDKRVEDKKDKIVEKAKEAAKATPVKQKQEPEGNKVDKKQKEKPKDTGSKDKDKANEKKTHNTLSSISKQGPPETKQEPKPISRSESKDSKSTKSEKDSTAKQEKDENQKSEAGLKSETKTAKHRSNSKESGKAASTTKSNNKESLVSVKKPGDASKSKREQEKISEKLVKQKQKQEEKLRLLEEKERQKEEKEREEQELKEKEEREKQKEKEEKERKEREEKEKREKERQKEEEERERQKEKERKEKERREREEQEKEKEERERQKEREKEEKEKREREREEKERQKEKEREEKERQKEKEEKERKEKEEKERLRKEKEERDKQKQKEQAEKESQKEKERLDRMKEKQKEKERKEKQKKDKKEMERKEKEKKAKEEKLKKEKEDRVRKEKDEKSKKEKEEKEKSTKEKEKADREKEKDEKKKPPPKKPKRNELAALLEHNDMIQMSFTSMYDRVKTQRNREPEPQHKSEPSPKSSFDKFKQNRKKNGSKVKSSLYSFDTSSGGSNDDLSSLSESEPTQKTESAKESKPKVTKQIKKRPHVSSSSSSSSCEEDDDALLRASKPKGKKNEIFSSDSDDSFQPPSNKQKASAKTKSKPTPKKRKTRNDSSDSMPSRDDFLKSQTISSVADSLDEIDMSDDEVKVKSKTKVKSSKSSTHSKDSESTVKKQQSVESESSIDLLSKKPGKLDKEESPDKKGKAEPKKSSKTPETKSSDKKKAKHDTDKGESLGDLSGKLDGEKPKSKPDSKSKQKSKNELDGKPELEAARSKAESETKPKSKTESESKHETEKSKSKLDNESKIETEKSKPRMEVESKGAEKSKPKAENQTKHGTDKPKEKKEVESKAEDEHSKSKMENESKVDVEKHKSKPESESRSEVGKTKPKDKSESRTDVEKCKTKHEPEVKTETNKHKVESDNNKNSDKNKNKLEINEKLKVKESSEGKNKPQEKKKKSEEESPMKKKKKQKMRYDPVIEEQLVNTLITKVYDKDKKEKKKSKVNVLDSEAEDSALVEALTSPEEKGPSKDPEVVRANEEKPDILKSDIPKSDIPKSDIPKPDIPKPDIPKPDKQPDVKSTLEAAAKVPKKEHKKKKEKREHTKEGEKSQESLKTEHPEKKEKSEPESQGKTEEISEDEHLKPPKKKEKKKKEHSRENDKDKISKQEKNHEKKSDGEKSHVSNEEKDKSDISGDNKSSSQVVDEFISFWGHPKPILIPKRLKDSKKTDDDKTKHKDESKAEGSSGKAEASKGKEDSSGIKEEKLAQSDDKLPDVSSDVDKTPEPAMNPKVESEASDDCVVPISEAETTIVTEITQPASSEYIESSADSLVIQDESAAEETAVLPDETTIGSSVEIDDDDFPLLVIDEIPESSEKKVTKKDKRLLKKEQLEKERNDHMDEVIARVAMAMPSDDEDTTSNDQELILSDVINQELKYESKMSSEHLARSTIVSDIFFTEKDKKQNCLSVAQKDKDNKIIKRETEKKKDSNKNFGHLDEETEKKKDSNKNFGQVDEETEKKDEELLKTLAVLCDPNLDKPVVIEDIKKEPTEEEIKKKEEEEKKNAEDERKKAEEEEKTRREKEEQEMREASDEAARAVESLLEFQSGYDQESLDMDDDLPPLIIEPAEKEPQIETVCISPSKDKLDIVSIFSSPIPDKVTANLDDKLLDEKLNEKGASDQSDGKPDPFNLFATPTSTGTPAPVFTSPRRNSSGLVKDKTPEPVMLPSPQKPLPPSSPQMQSPHRIHFPQRSLPSPQHQLQSPQKPVLPSQIDLQSPQPMLQSPQRSPFFTKDAKIERNFVPTSIDAPHSDIEILHAQLPQRNIPNLPVQTHHDQPLRPMQVSPRRKSQEYTPEQVLFSTRRNTIAAPEEATVAHLDRRFQPPIGSNMIFSKERTLAPSSLPPPVSISLDHAPHDSGSQSPMPSLIIPTHQENLLAPRKVSPAIQFKEIIHEQPIFQSPPGKCSLQDQLHHFHKDPIIQKQIFTPKGPTQEQLFYGAKGPPPDFFKTSKIEQPLLLPSKSPISEKPIPHQQVKALEPGLTPQKSPAQELLLPHSKGPQHPHLDPFSQHGKGVPPREPMFSPKVQPDNPFSYPDQNIDFLLSSPPRGNMGFMSYPPAAEVNMGGVSKPQDYGQDPMLIPVTEACTKPPEREVPHAKRVEGFPPSFYQEPLSGPKTHQEPAGTQQLQQQNFDDDKKGTKKRKRNTRKASNEDKAAALAKQQAIEESVQANVDSIRKALTANQAKAAAEKACMVGGDKKKTLDAYDFEAHIGQDVGVSSGPIPVDAMYPGFGETDSRALRSRNDRGRGRGGAATRRGRRGKGSVSSGLEPADTPQKPDALQHTQPPHFLTHMQGQDHLQPHMQQQNHPPHQHFPPLQQQHQQQPHHQQLPPPPSPQFQRQAPQPIQLGHQMPHYYPHPSPLSLENNSSASTPDWQQKQITQAYPHGQVPQQPAKMPPLKNDVLSPESNKQDLDLSYGESELIINLDDQPSSIEGKENQYNLSSDGEDRGLIPSPSTPKSQRSTRARKQPDYKAIASGNVQPPVQPRTSRSGGSPRGRGNGAQSPKSNMSPRTRSTESVSSSPVVKLEKLEVGRTTRSKREVVGGKVFGKDDMKETVGAGTSFEEWKAKISTDEGKSISKENIYEFEDNEQDQQIETSLRSARTRKKRTSDNQDQLQIQQLPDYMPGSPASSSNSSILFQDPRHGPDPAVAASAASVTEMKPPEELAKPVPLSNMDAIIDAVSKGNFGSSEEDLTPKVAVQAVSEPEPLSAPQQTRATRRSTETKKEPDTKADTKTFTIAEQPRFEGREVGRKGPTVPPLRIKVAHGTKVEKNEEKHYVIERTKSGGSAAEHEKPPLAFTVKLSDSGTATIKPAGGGATVTPISSQAPPVPGLKSQGGPGEMFKNDNSQKKENSLGLFSGLPQNDPKNAELDLNKQAVAPPAIPHTPSWKQLDPVNSDEAAVPRLTGGAMHPKVAAKVQASQESQNITAAAVVSTQQASLPQYPPSSTPNTPSVLPPKPMNPATPLGLKHAWNSGHPQDSSHQPPLSSDQLPPANSYLPTHLQSISQLASREAQMLHQPSNAHQDGKQQPGGYNQPGVRLDRPPPGKTNKPGMDINPDMISKLQTESPKQHQGSFGFSPHIPPAHSGQRSFILPPDQPGHHAAHFPNPAALLKSGPDSRPVKSPSIQPQPPSKMGPEVQAQTPPVPPAMLYTGVVSGQPHSLSPTSASPEGQVIERIQNPIRQSESSQSSSPLTLHLPGSHHPDPGSRFMKDDVGQDGLPPLSAHGDRASSQEMAMYKHILEQQRLQQHLIMAEAARSAAQEAARNSAPDSARNIAAMRSALESSRNTPVALDGGRKGPLTPSQPVSHGQPLNLTPQSDNRGGGQTDSSRVTPKSTPPAPQSPFTMQYFDRKGDSGSRLQVSVPGTFMQPNPSNHREGIPSHLYSDLGLANLTAHNPYLVGRIPIDPRIYGTGQQSSPHLIRDGVLPGSFPQAFPPGSRFPGLEHPDGKKGDTGHPDQAAPHMLRSPSPIHRQLQADVLRQQLTRMPCDLPTRDSPVGFLQRYPVMWQGALALKNDNSYVQMHFIAGNRRLPSQALPQPMQNGALPPLRISQRMRLEHAQLEGVAKRMQCEDHYCILIAVACGRDQVDISHQTRALSEGFINYLLSKQAAGIVNVPLPGSEQVRFVVHIFPPCEFVDNSVAQQGSVALMEQLREIPHAVIIIATT